MCRYIPLNRVNALVSDSDASPNCPFPSLSECDEIGKLTSTSLMCCNIGSLEAAVKVRTIDITGASADEVRSFEFSCLEEVRMLSLLKHPCIVEFYGHQISSKWSLAADWDSGVRSLQSAIFMEFLKGGSLKGTISFGIGFFFVIIGWPIIGIIIEAYGFVVLFSGFWPTLAVFLQKIPVVGWLFQQPIVRSYFQDCQFSSYDQDQLDEVRIEWVRHIFQNV